MNRLELLSELSKIQGVSFISFNYTAKESGEKSKVTVIVGASTENLYNKDVDYLTSLLPTLDGIRKEVGTELLDSRKESLEKGIGNNSRYTKSDTYVHLENLPGVKVHKEDGTLYITGLVHHKEVLEKGTYKTVNSSDRTIEKNKIRKELPSSRFREYVLKNIQSVRLNGNTLTFSE